jgi:tetratricopeptide (TPR) repeat protein
MRVLFSVPAACDPAPFARLVDEAIFCGPGWPDCAAADGRTLSLGAPETVYDLGALAAKLPPAQAPDAVVCRIDSTNQPRNLAAIDCPRVLLLGDTHRGETAVEDAIFRATAEPFDRVVLLNNRHHATLLQAAGVRNLFWLPGLLFPHSDADVLGARRMVRVPRLAFAAGAEGRGARLLGGLAARGVRLESLARRPAARLNLLGGSLLGFHASQNGELDVPAFEMLAAGAVLVADRLGLGAGLEELLDDGKEIVTYGDMTELAGVVQELIERPADAGAIGEAGARWFDLNLSENARRSSFRRVVLDGVQPAQFEFSTLIRPSVFQPESLDRVRQSLGVYQLLQKLHAEREHVRILIDKDSAPEEFEIVAATLPRVAPTRTATDGPFDLAIFGRERAALAPLRQIDRLWCWNGREREMGTLDAQAAAAGLQRDAAHGMFFVRRPGEERCQAAAGDSGETMARARVCAADGDFAAATKLALAELEREPLSADARVLLGEIALRKGDAVRAEKLFRAVLAVSAANAPAVTGLVDALRGQGRLREADETLERLLQREPHSVAGRLALARLRGAQSQPQIAEAILRHAASERDAPEVAWALGDFLKRTGRVLEALGWHRHALGCDDWIAVVDPVRRPVRVAFLLERAADWEAIAGLWRALAADARFSPQVLAAPRAVDELRRIEALPEARAAGVQRWSETAPRADFADVLFLQHATDEFRPEALDARALLTLVPRVALLPTTLAACEYASPVRDRTAATLLRCAWLVCASDERERAEAARIGRAGAAHIEVTGHPKLDLLRTSCAPGEFFPHQTAKRIVLWSPSADVRPFTAQTWSDGSSTFERWAAVLLGEIRRRPGLALLIRPEPGLFENLEQRGIWTRAKLDDFLRQAAAIENVAIDLTPSSRPAFAAAAAMVADASAALVEFAATGKPLLFLHNPHGPRLRASAAFVGRCASVAQTPAQIREFLDDVETGRDPLAEMRRNEARHFLPAKGGSAGEVIRDALLARLTAEAEVEPALPAVGA